MKNKSYNVGDAITYIQFGGQHMTVVVTNKERDVKNGRPGFDGYDPSPGGGSWWGYDDQIIDVVNNSK